MKPSVKLFVKAVKPLSSHFLRCLDKQTPMKSDLEPLCQAVKPFLPIYCFGKYFTAKIFFYIKIFSKTYIDKNSLTKLKLNRVDYDTFVICFCQAIFKLKLTNFNQTSIFRAQKWQAIFCGWLDILDKQYLLNKLQKD